MMENWKQIIWRQFGASIDMLENSIEVCPADIWDDGSHDFSSFWYMVFHTLFWLDLYLSGAVENFTPPEPFMLDELNPEGLLPERVYTKNELQNYLQHCREKCRNVIKISTEETEKKICKFSWGEVDFAELLLDNMRHVQHHVAQLNLLLRQKTDSAPHWVSRTKLAL